jgi:hypothetical protein
MFLICSEERDTDKSVDLCRMRYSVFKRHYPALVRLQRRMPFSVIDATGSVEECEAQIAHELRYQSSLDLDERTYASITTLPLARDIVQHSRKALVQRLDDYCLLHTDTYGQVCCGRSHCLNSFLSVSWPVLYVVLYKQVCFVPRRQLPFAHELRYQSSLDLDGRPRGSVTTLPLAHSMVQHYRKALVQRPNGFCLLYTDTYGQVCSAPLGLLHLCTRRQMGISS